MTTYKINWSSRGMSDLLSCIEFVANVSLKAADDLKEELFDAATSLSTFPERNPIFEMTKSFPEIVRKCIVSKRYILLYIIRNDAVTIYRVLDSRRKFTHLI